MKVEELHLDADLLHCSARTGLVALLRPDSACPCWETNSVCSDTDSNSEVKHAAEKR